jgi:hypothetical protein
LGLTLYNTNLTMETLPVEITYNIFEYLFNTIEYNQYTNYRLISHSIKDIVDDISKFNETVKLLSKNNKYVKTFMHAKNMLKMRAYKGIATTFIDDVKKLLLRLDNPFKISSYSSIKEHYRNIYILLHNNTKSFEISIYLITRILQVNGISSNKYGNNNNYELLKQYFDNNLALGIILLLDSLYESYKNISSMYEDNSKY